MRPIGLREPKYSPFGPGRVDREWTGVCAPAKSLKVTSVDGGVEDPKLEEKRRVMRENQQGPPLSEAERKFLVDSSLRGKTKRQINLGNWCSSLFFVHFCFELLGHLCAHHLFDEMLAAILLSV